MNRIILIGRLTRDPDMRYTPGGTPVTRFTMAVDRGRKNSAGQKETDFIRCSTWSKLADLAGNYLQKGRLIAVEGKLRINESEEDGQRRQYVEVVCDSVTFLDKAKDNTDAYDGFADIGTEVDGDGIPF